MKAVRFYGIHDIRYEDVPKPVPREDEALVKVLYAGICGSDLHIYNKGMFVLNIPEVMGHEFVGKIEAVGSQVTDHKVGELVIADPRIPCMQCESCQKGNYHTCDTLSFLGEARPGGYAEYLALPADTLLTVPNSTAPIDAVLSEPLAVAVHIGKMAQLQESDKLAIMGAGPIGLLTVLVARAVYHVADITVVDLSQERRKLAAQFGAKVCDKLPVGEKFGKIVEAAGQQATLLSAIEHLQANGTLYPVSIFENDVTMDIKPFVYGQLSMVGCNAYTRQDLSDALALISAGQLKVSPLVSRVFPLSECSTAFSLLTSPDKPAAKVLLQP